MSDYTIKNEWLLPATPANLFAFYLAIIVPLQSPIYEKYKLYPNAPRTIDIQNAEISDILKTGDRVSELETIILSFAEYEIGLRPADVYFPRARIQYRKISDALYNIGNNWVNYMQIVNAQIAVSVSSDADINIDYANRAKVNGVIFKILKEKMKDVSMIIKSLEVQPTV